MADNETPKWRLTGEFDLPVRVMRDENEVLFDSELVDILNALEAKAALADEIGIGGYRHSKATWADWLARYDALSRA